MSESEDHEKPPEADPAAKRDLGRTCMASACKCKEYTPLRNPIVPTFVGDICECGHALSQHLVPAE